MSTRGLSDGHINELLMEVRMAFIEQPFSSRERVEEDETCDSPLILPLAGLTLIDLLVAVAVIGVLASLLLMALIGARAKADSVRCLNNLRQIGIALRLYADEYDDRLPSARNAGPVATNDMTHLPQIQRVLVNDVSVLSNVFKCPSDKLGVFEREGSSYEWNASLNGRILHRIGQDRPDDTSTQIYLLRDREGWHPRGRKNGVFADGHAGKEK